MRKVFEWDGRGTVRGIGYERYEYHSSLSRCFTSLSDRNDCYLRFALSLPSRTTHSIINSEVSKRVLTVLIVRDFRTLIRYLGTSESRVSDNRNDWVSPYSDPPDVTLRSLYSLSTTHSTITLSYQRGSLKNVRRVLTSKCTYMSLELSYHDFSVLSLLF